MNEQQKKFNARQAKIHSLPDGIWVETFFGCNLRCPMCPVPLISQGPQVERHPKAMSVETYVRILEQVSDKPRQICLNILGEPLLNQHLIEFIEMAKKFNHKVMIYTNATGLTPEMSNMLVESGLDSIFFSIDGANKDTYEKIRKGAVWEEVMNNIICFHEYNSKASRKVFVRIDCIDSDLTRSQLESHRNIFKPFCDQVVTIPLDSWADQLKLPEELGGTVGLQRQGPQKRYPCCLLWTGLFISAEGNVMTCCHDFLSKSKLPNIHDKPLLDIWNEELSRWRLNHIHHRYEAVCEKCLEWQRMPEKFHGDSLLDKIRGVRNALLRRGRFNLSGKSKTP